MRQKLKEILSLLKKEYNHRKDLIEDNIKDIQNTPTTEDTIDFKLELDSLNDQLNKLNEGNVELQNAIKKYIKNYLNTSIDDRTLSYDECLQLTIIGDLDFSPKNPYFFDQKFYNDLLSHYIKKEDYEKCKMIKDKKNGYN